MANQDHLAKLKEGVEVWNQWREEHPGIQPDLQKANLREANLQKADLQEAFFDVGTRLRDAVLGDGRSGGAAVADLNWGGANLAVVDWTQVKVLGDEYVAQQPKKPNREMKTKSE